MRTPRTDFWLTLILAPFAATLVCLIVLYTITPAYRDHLEPTMVVLSQQWLAGYPLYHSPDSPYLYSMLYGPVPTLWMAAILQICPNPIVASKLAIFIPSLLSLAMLCSVFVKKAGWQVAIMSLGICSVGLMHSGIIAFSVRADSPMWLASSLAIFALYSRNITVGSILIGTAMAIAIGSKLHGVLYIMPVAVVWFTRNGWRQILVTGTVAAFLCIIPFLMHGISISGYMQWLKLAMKHGLQLSLMIDCLTALLLLMIPAVAAILASKGNPDRENAIFSISILVCALIVCIPASKAGAGPNHLLPFAPYAGYMFCIVMASPREWPGRHWLISSLIGILWLTIAIIETLYAGFICVRIAQSPVVQVGEELQVILQRYPARQMQMGVGGNWTYETTFSCPLLYAAGGPRVLDPGSFMDMQESGLSDAPLVNSLRNQSFRYWLIPKGAAPFTSINWYTNRDLFSNSVRETFSTHYQKTETTRFFDIYQAVSPPAPN
ncbi:MAG: hypothetical protein ACAI35_11665 [Candidatus Methylacidiphilales bacterium]